MKTKMLIVIGMMVASFAQATLYTYQFGSEGSPLGTVVPDGSVIGSRNDQTVSGIFIDLPEYSDVIEGVRVTLNLSGGYNGDLYGYLVSADGTRVDLFNRIGSGPLGNQSPGLNVILDDAAGSSIQDLDLGTGGGLSYQALGTLADLNGSSAMGTWSLFLADLSGGDGANVSTLVSWGLELQVVPEPVTWALIVFVGLASIAVIAGKRARRMEVGSKT